jgi:hypothetical protein
MSGSLIGGLGSSAFRVSTASVVAHGLVLLFGIHHQPKAQPPKSLDRPSHRDQFPEFLSILNAMDSDFHLAVRPHLRHELIGERGHGCCSIRVEISAHVLCAGSPHSLPRHHRNPRDGNGTRHRTSAVTTPFPILAVNRRSRGAASPSRRLSRSPISEFIFRR